MAYCLEPGEPIGAGLRRAAVEEAQAAATLLSALDGPQFDVAVHETRKAVKKIRAVLRLVRADLGAVYDAENGRLREIGHSLSDLRDSEVLIEGLDELVKRYPRKLGAAPTASIRGNLILEKQRIAGRLETVDLLRSARVRLRALAKRAPKWPLPENGFDAVAPAFDKILRKSRKAMKQASQDPRPEVFHEWRRRVKDHYYHVRLLKSEWKACPPGYAKLLKDLETSLGDDHNLFVLRQKIEAAGDAIGPLADRERLLQAIALRQAKLRGDALALGARAYAEAPRHMAAG